MDNKSPTFGVCLQFFNHETRKNPQVSKNNTVLLQLYERWDHKLPAQVGKFGQTSFGFIYKESFCYDNFSGHERRQHAAQEQNNVT